MEAIIEKLRMRSDILFAGESKTESIIVFAEQQLGTRFAPDYRACLAEFGTVVYDGHELNGITEMQRLDIVLTTLEQRELNPNVPNDWYVIEKANIDGIIVWQSPNGTVYTTVSDSAPKEYASGLISYLGL